MSGENCFEILDKIFQAKKPQKIEEIKGYTIKYGHIIENNEIIDEVLVSYFKKPLSYTTENMCEINSHGGNVVEKKILEICLKNGAELAEPGEFTKRAFLNGRLDLSQAEAVNSLIKSHTDLERKLALNSLSGKVSKKINSVRQIIIELLANIEVNIDFPEYEDALEITLENLPPKLNEIKKELESLLEEGKIGKIIENGIKVAIVGRPNVGKSSILNALLKENKAIVTDIAGTTRDIVEGEIELKGIALKFIDTAGIRKTDDVVEKIGVDKSMEMIDAADLVILVLNNNEELTDEDEEIMTKIKDKTHIIFINKNDLKTKLEINDIDVVKGNTIDIDGLDSLKNKIVELFDLEKINNSDLEMVSSAREIGLIKEALNSIENALNNVSSKLPVDMIAIDIKKAWDLLGEITGESYQDELLDTLFSKFCLGK